ncbi:MAG: cation-transporting P-type ATPase [Marinobacter sp.]|nr:cation-transporting P-type ATPase [Marinobacter sp.]
MSSGETLNALGSSDHGLTEPEVVRRLESYGHNRLPQVDGPGPLIRFLRQFHNVLIYILMLAAVGTALLGHWVDTGVIVGVVVINALVGFIQEGKAERALGAIRNMLSPTAQVIRDGKRHEVDAENLVPGDIIRLKAGNRVPADIRLVECADLKIEEASLTGESEAVEKDEAPVDENLPLGDRISMAYSSTLVTFGNGYGVVVGTGQQTEIGRISQLMESVEAVTTPLLRQVAVFGRWLSAVIVMVSAVTFAIGYWARQTELAEMFLAAVSLAVAAIPEGMPAILTITLAIGVQEMARRKAIIRRLPAVETLGAVTNICSDKTGTLTRNEMKVQTVEMAHRSLTVSGAGYEPVGEFEESGKPFDPSEDPSLIQMLRAGLLCNDAEISEKSGDWVLNGEPTEGALVAVARKAGLDPDDLSHPWRRLDLIPFASEHKFMATLNRDGDQESGAWIFLKGAPERVLERCSSQLGAKEPEPLDADYWHERMHAIADEGQRVLAVACRQVPEDQAHLEWHDIESDLVLLGLYGIMDPPRQEAIEAVAQCQAAGIRVVMITGDHGGTAQAIGRQLGIAGDEPAMTGQELESLSDEELIEAVSRVTIFARTSPEHKLRLVRALQACGEVVAMTGDGVNDAPALKQADVGIAMGKKGTEAAKEASEMVLADDNFATIARAVEQGRTVYDNIRKAILYLLPTNAGQALTIFMAVLMAMPLPLTPVQVLWVNMVTAVTLAMALAFEPTEPGTMVRPPRSNRQRLLSGGFLWRIPFVGLLLWAGTFGHFYWLTSQGADLDVARTAAIMTLVAGQIFYLFNVRHLYSSVLNWQGLFGSRPIWVAVGTLVALQAAFAYAPPLQTLFGTTGPGTLNLLLSLAFGAFLLLVVELEKWINGRFFNIAGTTKMAKPSAE